MSCSEIRDDLKAFADGELSVSARTAVDRHVSECSDCRGELEEIRRLTTELRAIDTAVPRADLRKRIMAQIPVPIVEPPAFKRSFWKSWWPSSLALAGTAAVILVVMFGGSSKRDLVPALDKEDKVASAPISPVDAPSSSFDAKSSSGAEHHAEADPRKEAGTGPVAKSQPKTAGPPSVIAPEHLTNAKSATPQNLPQLHQKVALVEPHENVSKLAAGARFESKSDELRVGKAAAFGAQKPALAGGSPSPAPLKDMPTGFAAANSAPKGAEPGRKAGLGDQIDSSKLAFGENGQRGRSQLGLQTQPNAVELTVDKLETGVAHLQEIAKQEGVLTRSLSAENKDKDGREAAYFLYIVPDKVEEVKQRLMAKDSNLLSYRAFGYVQGVDGGEGVQKNLVQGSLGAGAGGGFGGFGGGGGAQAGRGGSAQNNAGLGRGENRSEQQQGDANLKAPASGARSQSRGLNSAEKESADAYKKRQDEAKSEQRDRAYGRTKQTETRKPDNKPTDQLKERVEQNGNLQKLGTNVASGAARNAGRENQNTQQLFKSDQRRAVQEQAPPQRVELLVRIKEQPKPAGKKE